MERIDEVIQRWQSEPRFTLSVRPIDLIAFAANFGDEVPNLSVLGAEMFGGHPEYSLYERWLLPAMPRGMFDWNISKAPESKDTVDQLVNAVPERPYPALAAIFGLGMLGDSGSVGALIDALEHGDDAIRVAAAEALGRIEWQEDDSSRPEAVRVLRSHRTSDPCDRVRDICEAALWLVDELPGLSRLQEAMRSDSAIVRDFACQALARLVLEEQVDAGEALPLLIAATADGNRKVRASACIGLGLAGAVDVAPILVPRLEDKYPYVRGSAALALGLVGAREAADDLRPLLGDAYPYVRGSAALALGLVGAREAADDLRPLLGDAYPYVRGGAALALGLIQSIASLEQVAPLLFVDNEFVRDAALTAIHLTGHAVVAFLKEDTPEVSVGQDEVRIARVKAGDEVPHFGCDFYFDKVEVATSSDRLVESFCTAVQNDSDEARRAYNRRAEWSVASGSTISEETRNLLNSTFQPIKLRASNAPPILLDWLKRVSIDPSLIRRQRGVERRAILCLLTAYPRCDEVKEALTLLLTDNAPIVRMAAGLSLGYLGAKDAVRELAELLTDEAEDLRDAAYFALRRMGYEVAVVVGDVEGCQEQKDDEQKPQLRVPAPQKDSELFRFDRLVVEGGDEEKLEKFCTDVKNDHHPERREQNIRAVVEIAPGSPMREEMRNLLLNTFSGREGEP
jgi:HEAT repeat protein